MGQKINVTQRTLRDVRDTNSYTVRKLADGNCWMTQNLYTGGVTLTSSSSDVTSNFTLPSASNWCYDGTSSACTDTAKVGPWPGYDTYGSFYNWYTATAGTGRFSVHDTNMSSSICPKNWRLTATTDFTNLVSTYGGGGYLLNPPASFTLSGTIESGVLVYRGSIGIYWTNHASATTYGTPYSSDFYIDDNGTAEVRNQTAIRSSAEVVRCVAR